MNRYNLLLSRGFLGWVSFLLVSKFSLVLISILLFCYGSRCTFLYPMVNKFLGKAVGVVERCGFASITFP